MKHFIVVVQEKLPCLNYIFDTIKSQQRLHNILGSCRTMESLNLFASDIQKTQYAFIPVACLDSKDVVEHVSQWRSFSDISHDDNLKAIECVANSGVVSDSESCVSDQHSYMLADILHKLFDELPLPGTYRLQIFLDAHLFSQWYLLMPAHAHLGGVLLRASLWHMASFYSFNDCVESCLVDDWLAPLQLSIWQPTEATSCHIWRGHLTVDKGKSFCGMVDLSVDVVNQSDTLCHSSPQKIFPGPLDLVSCCDNSTIPILIIDKSNPITIQMDSNLEQLIMNSYLTAESKCIVARLPFFNSVGDVQASELNHKSWQRACIDSDGQYPFLKPTDFPKRGKPEGFVHFYLVLHQDQIVAYPLHPSGSFNSLFLLKNHFTLPQSKSDVASSPLSPIVHDVNWSDVGKVTKPSFRELLARKKEEQQALMIQCALERLNANKMDQLFISDYLCDGSDWWERRFLLERAFIEKRERQKIETHRPNPGTSTSKVVNCDAEDITKLFNRKGEPKYSQNIEPLHVVVNRTKPTIATNCLEEMDFDEALKHVCHDLYYNRTEDDEQNEARCHLSKDLYIRNQIGCTVDGCTLNKVYVPKGNAIRRTMSNEVANCSETGLRRSPRKKLFQSCSQPVRKLTPRKRTLASNIRDQQRKFSRFGSLHSSDAESTESLGISERNSSPWDGTPASPLPRRSPRKRLALTPKKVPIQASRQRKTPVKAKFPLTKTSSSQSTIAVATMDEKLRLKLRVAVADALEAQGISLSDPLFKSCGKKLFAICKTFAEDLHGVKRASSLLRKVADSHVKQVIDFERIKSTL